MIVLNIRNISQLLKAKVLIYLSLRHKLLWNISVSCERDLSLLWAHHGMSEAFIVKDKQEEAFFTCAKQVSVFSTPDGLYIKLNWA